MFLVLSMLSFSPGNFTIIMKVTVKTLQQTNFPLEIEPSETVKTLKKRIKNFHFYLKDSFSERKN